MLVKSEEPLTTTIGTENSITARNNTPDRENKATSGTDTPTTTTEQQSNNRTDSAESAPKPQTENTLQTEGKVPRIRTMAPAAAPSPSPMTSRPTTTPTGSTPPKKVVKIPPKLQHAIDKNNPNRSIVLVHVGKAGGITVRDNVAAKCNDIYKNLSLEKERIGRLKCYEHFPLAANRLANQTRHVVHMWSTKNEAMMKLPPLPSSLSPQQQQEQEQVTTFLFTLRNPIDRIHSSYRYGHPANCKRTDGDEGEQQQKQQKEGNSYGCWAKDHGMMVPGHPYYEMWNHCFPSANMESFAQELLPPYPQAQNNQHYVAQNFTKDEINNCRQKARQLVQGKLHKGKVGLHMQYNYKYYMKETIQKFPHVKEIFALRTEHEYDDMVTLDIAMGGFGQFRHPKEYRWNHGSQHYQPSALSSQAYHKLCCVLVEEIQVYFQIFDKSLNLDQKDRKQASNSLRTKCGIPSTQSWSEWYGKCRQKLNEMTPTPTPTTREVNE